MSEIRSIAAQLPAPGEPPRWFAFRTMYKREKVVSKRLGAAGMETYVPLRTVVKHYASKTVVSHVPLLSSYVFVRLTAKQYPVVLADGDVFEIVRFNGEVGRVTDEEIALLKTVLRDGGEDFEPQTAEGLGEGAEVVVNGGALAGTRVPARTRERRGARGYARAHPRAARQPQLRGRADDAGGCAGTGGRCGPHLGCRNLSRRHFLR